MNTFNTVNTQAVRQQTASGLLAAAITLVMLLGVDHLAQPSADNAQQLAARAAATLVAAKS